MVRKRREKKKERGKENFAASLIVCRFTKNLPNTFFESSASHNSQQKFHQFLLQI